ncbi:MAG: 4Fe-4S binding protein [candidate division Zixibacteria bacterium]|nr:4Fe-4S binding protein [candidate division Zixibacteria bacterium]
MALRKVIRIDENKCDGCGLCVPACAEGAIQIIDGKAKLVSETYCDGLGACLGECPQGAITIDERDAENFDPEAVKAHLASQENKPKLQQFTPAFRCNSASFGCPGQQARSLQPTESDRALESSRRPSQLRNWPVQLHLVPTNAPYFSNARLLIAADCVPFALAGFHENLLAGRVLIIGCPKLDDNQTYLQKLITIFRDNAIKSVELAYMEVPCCLGMVRLVQTALKQADTNIPLYLTKIGIGGDLLESTPLEQSPIIRGIQ